MAAASSAGTRFITPVEQDRGAKAFAAKYNTKLTVLGSAAVGKTCIVRQLCFNKYQETYKVTLGADFGACLAHLDGSVAHVQIWDTAGHERFNSMGQAFYRGSQGCVLVYDVTSRKSFDDLSDWKDIFEEQLDLEDPASFPFVVVGNKSDLPAADHQVTEEEAVAWAAENHCLKHYLCSAKEMTNVKEMILDTVEAALARQKEHDTKVDTTEAFSGGIHIDEPVEPASGCPC